MRLSFQTIRQVHGLFLRHMIYPLLLSSLLASGILVGRIAISHYYTYIFLQWNLLLAWIPLICSIAVAYLHSRYPRRLWYLAIPFLLWLLFLPNAPYIVTDLVHLEERPPVPFWYDLGMLLTFGWTGCFLAVVSLNMMQAVVRSLIGRAASWLFVASTIALSGLGIYLGRFLEWNSWDLLLHPAAVLGDLAIRLIDPLTHLQTYGVSLMFGAFFFVCYLTFVSIRSRGRA